jgi:hypothetical protein
MPTATEATREELDSATNLQDDEELKPRAWWLASDLVDGSKHYRGFEDSLKLLLDTLSKDSFSGIFGFSQGAAMAGILAALLNRPTLHPLLDSYPSLQPLPFSILVAGFKSTDPKLEHFWTDKVEGNVLQCASASYLHQAHSNCSVLGRADAIVAEDRTAPFVEAFASPRVEWHDGGHHVPSKAAWRSFFASYISSGGSDEVPSPAGSSSGKL